MKKTILILSMLLSTQSVFSAARTHEILCPQDGIGSARGDKPAVLVKTRQGHLLVCGFQEGTLYSEFDIYSESKGKFSKSLFQVGALATYNIEPFEGGVHLIELIAFRGKQVPFQKLAMNCNLGDTCSISRATCETQDLSPFKTDILKRITPFYINGKNPSEEMISELSDLAMTGNPDAIQIFQKNPGIKIDGAAAEVFKKTKERLQHPCFQN